MGAWVGALVCGCMGGWAGCVGALSKNLAKGLLVAEKTSRPFCELGWSATSVLFPHLVARQPIAAVTAGGWEHEPIFPDPEMGQSAWCGTHLRMVHLIFCL